MEFNLPSYANDYPFVTCYKSNPSQEVWELYGVADTMNEVQHDIETLRDLNAEYLIIMNINNYERKYK